MHFGGELKSLLGVGEDSAGLQLVEKLATSLIWVSFQYSGLSSNK